MDIERRYYEWLIGSIDPRHIIGEDYQPVFDALYFTEFRWSRHQPDDENRAADGLWLRRVFADEIGEDERIICPAGKKCSCLEMLVALARRIEYDIVAIPGEENVPKWFWMFMNNLGIGPHDDRISDRDYIFGRIKIWLDRKYARDGYGGIFVIKDPYFDMRRLPIWRQMNIVLNETMEF